MAMPPTRRPGSSRRAQMSLFTGYVLAGAGALLGGVLLVLSLLRPMLFADARAVAFDATAPVAGAATEVRVAGQTIVSSVLGYFRAGSQNASLKAEMEVARIRLAEAEALRAENARLKGLLDLDRGAVPTVATGRLIGSTATSTRRIGYLDLGAADGVRVGMPVRSARGIVGRILETGRTSSRVLLLTDGESLLPVRRVEGDVIAFAQGRGDGMLQIRLVNLGINPLKRGDVFVTSGAGGYFHPGVAVAIVERVVGDGALARLISDPAGTDYVAVQPVYAPQAIAAVAQIEAEANRGPGATPSPSPTAAAPVVTATQAPASGTTSPVATPAAAAGGDE